MFGGPDGQRYHGFVCNPPPMLAFNTTLVSTKRCRANYGHHGEMSLWQTYGAWAYM